MTPIDEFAERFYSDLDILPPKRKPHFRDVIDRCRPAVRIALEFLRIKWLWARFWAIDVWRRIQAKVRPK